MPGQGTPSGGGRSILAGRSSPPAAFALQWCCMSRHEWFFREHGHLLRDRLLYLHNPTFGNPAWAAAELRVLVVRLSSFRDVDRSSTHLVLARELRRDLRGSFVDLAFLPVPEDRALLERHGVPLLVGTQSHRTLEEFDLVLVSNS